VLTSGVTLKGITTRFILDCMPRPQMLQCLRPQQIYAIIYNTTFSGNICTIEHRVRIAVLGI